MPSGLLSHFKRAIISGLRDIAGPPHGFRFGMIRWNRPVGVGGPRPPARRRTASSHHRNQMEAAGLWPSRPMAQEALDHPVHRVGGPGQQLVNVAA